MLWDLFWAHPEFLQLHPVTTYVSSFLETSQLVLAVFQLSRPVLGHGQCGHRRDHGQLDISLSCDRHQEIPFSFMNSFSLKCQSAWGFMWLRTFSQKTGAITFFFTTLMMTE
jgi:hypothetical protein